MRRKYYRRHSFNPNRERPFFQDHGSAQLQEEQRPFFMARAAEGLSIGEPGDKYEVEADAMADAVTGKSGTGSAVQRREVTGLWRKCDQCAEEEQLQAKIWREEKEEEPEVQTQMEEEEALQAKAVEEEEEDLQRKEEEEELRRKDEEEEEEVSRKASSAACPVTGPPMVRRLEQSKGGGQTLPVTTRQEMEHAFGADFSKVTIHRGSGATAMSEELHAQAFTHGNDIYFNSGKYQPETHSGRHLLAHELTHVVQQQGSGIYRKEIPTGEEGLVTNPLVGLKRGDGLIFGTWHLRPRVKLLQQKLNEKMAAVLKTDGMFGPKTAEMLNVFRLQMTAGTTDTSFMVLQTEEDSITTAAADPIYGGPEVVDQPTADALMGTTAKKEIPLIKSDIMYVLTPPPPICQSESPDCWAAAAASWLNVTAILPGATRAGLIIRFGHCICDDGSMPEVFVPPVYRELGIKLSDVDTFDYEFLKSNLKKHGHVILIVDFPGSVEHAVVAYAVGVSDTGEPDIGFYSVFDPIDCKYHNLRFNSQNILSIGRRSQPGPRALCPDVVGVCGD